MKQDDGKHEGTTQIGREEGEEREEKRGYRKNPGKGKDITCFLGTKVIWK